MLPTFIVIGSMKCGTSSLAAYLRAHPDVFMTTPKEPGFFDAGMTWSNGLAWYEQLFAEAGHAGARGEASTHYTKAPSVPGVPARIASVVPDVRLVYLVRNPIARISSHYRHDVDKGDESRSLVDAIAHHPEYIDFTRYAFQLSLYLEHFSSRQVLVISSEQLLSDRLPTLQRAFEFIGVDSSFRPPNIDRELNRGAAKQRLRAPHMAVRRALRRTSVLQHIPTRYKRGVRRIAATTITTQDSSIPQDLESAIWDRLEPDIRELRTIVGPDFDLWGHG